MVSRHQAPRAAPRGPAAGRAKADRDGDVAMGVAVKGRAGVSKKSASTAGPKKDLTSRTGKGGILSSNAQRKILRKAGTGDVSMTETRIGAARSGLVELKVTGWNKSKASGDADSGVSALIKWMEKKGSTKLGSRGRNLKIKKVCRRHTPIATHGFASLPPHPVRLRLQPISGRRPRAQVDGQR